MEMSACQAYKSRSGSRESALIQGTDAKMNLFSFSIVCAFLQISHQTPPYQWPLLPHTLVVEVDGSKCQLPLSCLQPEELMSRGNRTLDIIWKRNGEVETQRGNTYQVWLQESTGGANYSCHSSDGSLLNYTQVLIQEGKSMKRKILVKNGHEYLKCSAKNFNGEFRCSWTWDSFRVGSVAFLKVQRALSDNNTQCSVDDSGQQWSCSSHQSKFRCSVDSPGNSITCNEEQHCPYAEERQQIHVSVFVRTKHFLVENYSRHFFLSEIVKPEKVELNRVNATMIEWSYPTSWSSPFSYFPLTFQIAQLKRECKTCLDPCTDSKKTSTVNSTGSCQLKLKKRSKVVCVRSKDLLCNSQWSEWSHLRLKRNRRNK